MAMNTTNRETEREDLEALLPWHANGTLNRRDANRVEHALACDRELAKRYSLVREELAETIHLNETLGAPSARAMEKLFAAIEAEEARSPRRRPSFDPAQRFVEFMSSLAPRTLVWSAAAVLVAVLAQTVITAGVLLKGESGPAGPKLASVSRGSFAVIRFAPQATAAEITNFLGAYKASLVEGPLRSGGGLYRIRIAERPLQPADVSRIIHEMQDESRIVGFVASAD
jgi:hypothetical protein